ncbi:MAG: UDP-3-O-(3-hydroxymyristoyl)glucosamine N-acyltransferase, partial [Fimbriimonadaceae bacterium]
AESGGIGALLIGPDQPWPSVPAIRVADPRRAIGFLLSLCERRRELPPGVHPTAVIDASAAVDPSAAVGPYVVVDAEARVEAGAKLFAHAYVGPRCVVGRQSVLLPHAVLVQDVVLGAECVVHSGAVLGAEGFGFVWDGQRRQKIPQIGKVETGDSVEIGALTAVDRATIGATRLGDGVKLDNLIQVGHNCEVGDHTVIAGHVGIAGSAHIGRRNVIGGAVIVRDHIETADDVVVYGGSGIDRSVSEPGEYFGSPLLPASDAKRVYLLISKLPEILSRVRSLEKKLAAFEKENA